MTREQKEEVKRLRGAGMSYQAVGERFGVSKQRIHQITHPKPRKRKHADMHEVKYLGIRRYLEENYLSMSMFANLVGMSNSTVLWRSLKGDGGMTKKTIDAILRVTGLTYEQAFTEEEKNA